MKYCKLKILLLFFISILLLYNCYSKEENHIQKALSLAGKNRHELQKVLDYYKSNPKDSLKYQAASYLIQNMPTKGWYPFYLRAPSGKLYSSDSLPLTSTDSIIQFLQTCKIEISPPHLDLQYISSKFLIENIELAFHTRERFPWCKNLSFQNFCETILPYRVKQEPLEKWRSYYLEKFGRIADSLASKGAGIKDVVFFINKNFQRKYRAELINIPGDIPYKLTEQANGGLCHHLALNSAQILRSLGIPLNYDILPYHGKINGGHAYNSFTDENGVFYYFSPYEREPERKKWIAPLILRATYTLNQSDNQTHITPQNALLFSPLLKNVTTNYFPTSNILLKNQIPQNDIYLTTFNRGKFKAVAYAHSDSLGNAIFPYISHKLLYFPATLNK